MQIAFAAYCFIGLSQSLANYAMKKVLLITYSRKAFSLISTCLENYTHFSINLISRTHFHFQKCYVHYFYKKYKVPNCCRKFINRSTFIFEVYIMTSIKKTPFIKCGKDSASPR